MTIQSARACSRLDAVELIAPALFAFARAHSSRYRLLFSDPTIASAGGDLESQAMDTFSEIVRLITAAQETGLIKPGDPVSLTALIYATVHGLIDIALSGRARDLKGLGRPEELPRLLLTMFGPQPST